MNLPPLEPAEQALLDKIITQMPIVADLSRGELLLYSREFSGKSVILAHSHPHSVAPAYQHNYAHTTITLSDMPVISKAFANKRSSKGKFTAFATPAEVEQRACPIFSPSQPRRVIAALSIDLTLIESERHRRRSRHFKRALKDLQWMLTLGKLTGADKLSTFGEQDGLMLVDKNGTIIYTSGVNANLFRRLGFLGNLENQSLKGIQTNDRPFFNYIRRLGHCAEKSTEDNGRHWVRKGIPVRAQPSWLENLAYRWLGKQPITEEPYAYLIISTDVTEERRAAQELKIKNAMIQEIHHRVKNNLQTIAAMLRIQSRRTQSTEATTVLKDAVNRVTSVAVIHEYLSEKGSWRINFRDVSHRIATQTIAGIVGPEQHIAIKVNGPSMWLPPRQATACALVLNELLQNAIEHGFSQQQSGTITINLEDGGDHVIISVVDNGAGLPEEFSSADFNSLGLQIANTLTTEDLQGRLNFYNNDQGAVAKMTFPKMVFEGEEGWKKEES